MKQISRPETQAQLEQLLQHWLTDAEVFLARLAEQIEARLARPRKPLLAQQLSEFRVELNYRDNAFREHAALRPDRELHEELQDTVRLWLELALMDATKAPVIVETVEVEGGAQSLLVSLTYDLRMTPRKTVARN